MFTLDCRSFWAFLHRVATRNDARRQVGLPKMIQCRYSTCCTLQFAMHLKTAREGHQRKVNMCTNLVFELHLLDLGSRIYHFSSKPPIRNKSHVSPDRDGLESRPPSTRLQRTQPILLHQGPSSNFESSSLDSMCSKITSQDGAKSIHLPHSVASPAHHATLKRSPRAESGSESMQISRSKPPPASSPTRPNRATLRLAH
ncbi:uncharacterized protein J3D65DRAFT_393619 [Phyllosticta citribraziliensis]|uniref:Uncharacterized protein n=1 Tax=Phyllosticta citribraziliensis TaxID=989973 RepID=A0ABR1LL26_9PEZI